MRAAFLAGPGRVEVGDFPDPVAPGEGDLIVRMERGSICGSDVHAVYHGEHNADTFGRPGYPGHEGIGQVVESRSATIAVGTRVLTVPIPSNGGCFAEYLLVDDGHVIPLPGDGDPARLLMAQQYGTTLYAMRMYWRGPATGTAAIIGAGSAGLFFLQQVKQLGFANIVVADLNTRRLEVAKRLGAATTVRAPGESFVDAVRDVTAGAGAELVIEASGRDTSRAAAIHAVAFRGTIGLFGLPESRGNAEVPMYDAFRKTARLQWAGGAQLEPGLVAFSDAVRHIHEGTIDVSYCLEHVSRLDDFPAAMEAARDQGHGSVKISIDLAAPWIGNACV